MLSISHAGIGIEDCQFKSIKEAEPLLTLPKIIVCNWQSIDNFNYFLAYPFTSFFLIRLNPNVAPPTIKSVDEIGSGTIATIILSIAESPVFLLKLNQSWKAISYQ